MSLAPLAYIALFVLTTGVALLGYLVARTGLPPVPAAGHRGRLRQAAIRDIPGFRWLEPALRAFGRLLARLPVGGTRHRLSALIERAGTPLGLNADEVLALCVLSASACAVAAHLAGAGQVLGSLAAVWLGVVGGALPVLRLRERMQARAHQIVRALPEAIDLTSLCMNAGLDFQGALDLLVRIAPNRGEPLIGELERVLEALRLGHTRRAALEAFAERVPTAAVQDLVTSVVLAEQKGTPLASVLEIQASMLRLRRSVMAEERAARAATLLAFPLMLMLCSVLLLLFGPFVVNGLGF